MTRCWMDNMFEIGSARIELVKGDITSESTDAIVNAANSSLLGGGGVDGAIHRAGGPEILSECRTLGGCPPGEARITTGGKLKARHVIHTVGPVYRGGASGERNVLAAAYRNSLELASKRGLKSISFPSISTGAYGYPVDDASRVALREVINYLKSGGGINLVRFVLFDDHDYDTYKRSLDRLISIEGKP